MIDHDGEEVAICGVQGPLSLEDALFMGRKANRIAPLQVVRADRVLATDHVVSAAMHANRALAEGRNHADRMEVEFVRYLAGKRQIKQALAHVGLLEQNDEAVLVAFGAKRCDAIQYFVHGLGLEVDDSLLAWSQAKQDAWPLAGSHEDEILSTVASVDLMRS